MRLKDLIYRCYGSGHSLLSAMVLVSLLSQLAYGATGADLLHNSEQFACSLSLYTNSTDCTNNNGTWSPNRKWSGGWGKTDTEYGTITCNTCHNRNTSNIKLINQNITATVGTFPGGTPVTALQSVPGGATDFGDDSDLHSSSERVCEVCHSLTRYHRHDTSAQLAEGGSLGHFNHSDCVSCHQHSSGFRAGCSDCHGNSTTGAYWPDGLANNLQPSYSEFDDSGSHARHIASLGGNAACSNCHPLPEAGTTHLDSIVEMAETHFSYTSASKTCSNIDCHANTDAEWGGTSCLGCHTVIQGNRAAAGAQFSGNSHHIQETTVSNAHCYQCHWEANSDGTINADYHGGTNSPAAVVDLVIYGAESRPTSYAVATTALQYSADGSRTEIAALNEHCLGCHSAQNSLFEPFGDGKTPQEYAWDGTSVDERYSQTGTTSYGKYTAASNAAQKIQIKAYSAHGLATANQGGWSAATGIDGALPNTRSGAENILCYDCHNSHGSNVSGTTTSYSSATTNGGILKDTQNGLGGYIVTYQPTTGGSAAEKNERNPGASLCLDCHMTADGSTAKPWGYQATFGASKPILGYYDPPYFKSTGSGQQTRYAYKNALDNKGGHFGASSSLDTAAMGSIGGLCTPCHDPHGVSPSLGANKGYGVPLLKGTWLTSPYKEDVAPAVNGPASADPPQTMAPWNNDRYIYLDQNTFGSHFNQLVTGISESEEQFAGLCLSCHPKSSLTTDGSGTPNVWLSKDRIHEAVKGWKTSNATVKHTYSCSKCHAPHSTGQPRLMLTNCMNSRHKGRVATQANPRVSGSYDMCNYGEGRIPGDYSYYGLDCPGDSPGSSGTVSIACHEGNTGSGTNQKWNSVTPWGEPPPVYYGTIRIAWNDCENYPANAPTAADSAQWWVRKGSRTGPIVASGSNGGAGWGGIDDISVQTSTTDYFVEIYWVWNDYEEEGTVYHDNISVTSQGQIVHLSY